MPSSHAYQISDITELLVLTDPQSILDIGVGFGKYGFLAREFLELWGEGKDYSSWKRRIDGIEGFKEYLTPVHEFIYNKIHVGNAIDVLPKLDDKYDLILLIDVLEHFEFEDGRKLIKECMRIGKNVLVSTPKDIGHQHDVFENQFERHLSQWERKHFDQYPDKFFLPSHKSYICFIGEDANRVERLRTRKARRRGRSLFRDKLKNIF